MKWQVHGVSKLPAGVGESDEHLSVEGFVNEEVLSLTGSQDAEGIPVVIEDGYGTETT